MLLTPTLPTSPSSPLPEDKSYLNDFISHTNFPPFSTLNPTLKMHICGINGIFNKEAIYELLPVTQVVYEQKKKKKVKIPHYPDSIGKIISIAYGNSCRGIYRPPFKNNTSLVICLQEKNAAIKFFDDTVCVAGAKSIDHINEALDFLQAMFVQKQAELDYIQANQEPATKTVKWLSDQLEGPDDTINKITELEEAPDLRIAQFLLSYIDEFNVWSDYRTVMDYFLTVKSMINGEFTVKHITLIMTNYNFSLGFEIDRDQLAQEVQAKTKFKAYYDKTVNYAVKLTMPYIRDENFKFIKKKKSEKYRFVIQVYKSGKITFTGPSPELMAPVYKYFREFICSVSDKIRQHKITGTTGTTENETEDRDKVDEIEENLDGVTEDLDLEV